jgi:hypothetical protein
MIAEVGGESNTEAGGAVLWSFYLAQNGCFRAPAGLKFNLFACGVVAGGWGVVVREGVWAGRVINHRLMRGGGESEAERG